MISNSKRGVFYIAAGKKYIEEAIFSAATVKRHMPELSVAICADENPNSEYVDTFIKMENPNFHFKDKPEHMGLTPFEETLFLDTDKYLVDCVIELFDLLGNFDFGATPALLRKSMEKTHIPNCFAEVNSGVLIFRKTKSVEDLFEAWNKYFLADFNRRNKGYCPDQPSLREALFGANLRFVPLPPEYNLRFPYPCFADEKVKILHGRTNNSEELSKFINSSQEMRVIFGDFMIDAKNQQPFFTIIKQRLGRFFKS